MSPQPAGDDQRAAPYSPDLNPAKPSSPTKPRHLSSFHEKRELVAGGDALVKITRARTAPTVTIGGRDVSAGFVATMEAGAGSAWLTDWSTETTRWPCRPAMTRRRSPTKPDQRQFVISTCDAKFLQLARQKFRYLGERARFYAFSAPQNYKETHEDTSTRHLRAQERLRVS